ncbi:MAG: hypothetical protein JO124_06035 [Hyphomicrobiales bacterium]|nr:hypothetical protein [Hyphomicrobiales bacterium]MBV9591253.1 hypothetical protein [Hyphomicrobiales bacterium]
MRRRADLLRAHAQNAKRMAKVTRRKHDRDALLSIAIDWLNAAERLERSEAAAASGEPGQAIQGPVHIPPRNEARRV